MRFVASHACAILRKLYMYRYKKVFLCICNLGRSLGTPVNSLTRNGPYGKLQSPLGIARDSSIPWLLRMNEWITHITEIERSRM